VFLVLSTRQLKISTLFILVSPLVPETDPWESIRQFFNSNRINFYELFLKYCWKPNKVFQIRFFCSEPLVPSLNNEQSKCVQFTPQIYPLQKLQIVS
jgi:hypothetical protein